VFGRRELLGSSPLWSRVIDTTAKHGKVITAEHVRDYFQQLIMTAATAQLPPSSALSQF
jgi:hypothetical protein